ncbi:MAG TPA: hypothetical protein VJQ53_01100 [Candidatus Eisenbacteria bacterium]|nr:hypothetical protein [Candidatus Eisenbacteria bacterium]
MRLHHRLPSLALAASLALSLCSCQTLAGKGGSPKEFEELKQALADDRAGLNRAVAAGEVDGVSQRLQGISTRFDEIWAKSSAMNLLDREHLAIQLASGRKMITSINQWVSSTDIDAIRSEVEKLNPVLDDVDTLLDHTIRATAADNPAPEGS